MNAAVRLALVASAVVYAAARALHAFGEAFERQIAFNIDLDADEIDRLEQDTINDPEYWELVGRWEVAEHLRKSGRGFWPAEYRSCEGYDCPCAVPGKRITRCDSPGTNTTVYAKEQE